VNHTGKPQQLDPHDAPQRWFQRFGNLPANVLTRPGSDNRQQKGQLMAGQGDHPGTGGGAPARRRAAGAMTSTNVDIYRTGHEAFNRRDFEAMTNHYADSIAWTEHSQARTFRTPREFRHDFLNGWVVSSSDIRITGPRYFDAGQTVVCTFTVTGSHDGPLGPFPATGKEFALPLCEMWHFGPGGRVVGGDLYYDQVSLLMQLGLMPQPPAA
jgi:hypothetical protein